MKPIFVLAALSLCVACSVAKVHAETAPPLLQAATPIGTASIELRNVQPSTMAFWLDPSGKITSVVKRAAPLAANPQVAPPGVYVVPTKSRERKMLLQVDKSLVVLPDGIEKIIADDTQNRMTVRGSSESIERVRELIAFLDKPVSQVKFEAQMVRLPKTLLLRDATKIASSNADIAVSNGEPIETLIASNRAKVIHGARLSTFNKMSATMFSCQSQTIFATPLDDEISKQSYTLNWGQNCSVIPTIQREGTISLDIDFFDGFFQVDEGYSGNITPLSSSSNRTVKTVVCVNSGKTVCLFNAKHNDGNNVWVLLVKASLTPQP